MEAHPFRTVWEAGDPAPLFAVLGPDVVLHSPILSEPFRGRDEVKALYEVLFDVVHELRFTDEFAGDGSRVFFWHALVGGRSVDGMDLLREDPDGTIREITVMSRPLAGAAAFASAAGPGVARRRGALNAAAMAAIGKPLPGLLALGDLVAARLAYPGGPRKRS